MGVSRPRARWRRFGGSCARFRFVMASLSSVRVSDRLRFRTFFCSKEKSRFHRCVVTVRRCPAHRSAQAVVFTTRTNFLDLNWDAQLLWTTVPAGFQRGHGGVHCGDGQGCLYPPVHRVPADPVRMQVPDRARGQLALLGVVLDDVRPPFPVRCRGAEVPFDDVIVKGALALSLSGAGGAIVTVVVDGGVDQVCFFPVVGRDRSAAQW
ncbi:hypothetical protein QFZ57_001923 [Arthrobacter sp. B1I2]|nr:hypothetical protein [Arthrobacter sp. B1I2]